MAKIFRYKADSFVLADSVGISTSFSIIPKRRVAILRKSHPPVDIFTFMQKLPDTSPKYNYPMEWDNLAVLPVTTFDDWWTRQIGFKARNKAKQASKKGVIVREVGFDDALALGIWGIYNESPVRQGRRFPHYGKSFEEVRRMSSTFLDSSIFIGAYLDEKLIGFIKLTADDSRTAGRHDAHQSP